MTGNASSFDLRSASRSCALLLPCWLIAATQGFAPAQAERASAERIEPTLIAQVPGSERAKLLVVHPRSGAKIGAPGTYILGACQPGAKLTANGAPVRVNKQGFFAHVFKLKRGINDVTIATDDGSAQEQIQILRPIPTESSRSPDKLEIGQIEPKEDQGVAPGDLIILKARATPGGTVKVMLGNKTVVLSPASEVQRAKAQAKRSGKKGAKPAGASGAASPTAQVNDGLAAAYGKVFQALPANAGDLYVGFYKVQPVDQMNHAPIKFQLTKNGKSMTLASPGTVSVITQPYMAQTVHDDTVMRAQPGKARLTQLPKGVRLTVDGWQGKNLRCLYARSKHVWVEAGDIAYEQGTPQISAPPARSTVRTINVTRDQYGDAVVVPLDQRLPFQIEQQMNPNILVLNVYGAIADTDWASQKYRTAFEEGVDDSDAGEKKSGQIAGNGGLVDGVTWKQLDDDVYQVQVKISGDRQWGFHGTYSGTNLVLHIKNPPFLVTSKGRLAGLTVCVDPGHGGAEPGAIGCSGVTEASVNLAIAMKLKVRLEAEGARVIMTRVTDKTVGLYERVDMARANGADILLSVHNNSLPDGRDPWKEHGSSAYWYHPQSSALARSLNDALVTRLGFPDIGARYQNLALTRAASMLSVLVEVGFMIHPDEYAQLLLNETQEKAALALVDGLANYLRKPAGRLESMVPMNESGIGSHESGARERNLGQPDFSMPTATLEGSNSRAF